MSDLLSIGRSGVLAYQGALATLGENVTNADTDGYSRRSVVLAEQDSGSGTYTLNRSSASFGGVQASQVQRVWDQYKAQSAWSANSDASRSSTRAQYLSSVETMLGDSSSGVSAKLTAVFAAGTQLASNPADTSLRQTMLSAVSDAASAIGQAGSDLSKMATTVSQQASTLADQVNSSLTALSKVNLALETAPMGSSSRAQLEDQRDTLIGSISGNIAVDVTVDANGGASLKLSNYSGVTLLASNSTSAGQLQVGITTSGARAGAITLTVVKDGTTSIANPTGGALSGLVDVSNTISDRRHDVDSVAAQLVTDVNAWQGRGTTAAGTAGQPLLTGTDAASIAVVDPAAQPADIAAALNGADNGNLLKLTDLRSSTGVEAKWQGMVNTQALLVSSANTESTAAASRKDTAYTTLDEVSGVDLDTEAAELLRFQQAYSASAKVIQAARDTLNDVLALFN